MTDIVYLISCTSLTLSFYVITVSYASAPVSTLSSPFGLKMFDKLKNCFDFYIYIYIKALGISSSLLPFHLQAVLQCEV